MSRIESESFPGNSEMKSPSGQRSEDLRQDIEMQKESIAGTLKQLDRRLHLATDWRTQIGEHPYVAIGIAFGVGALLSGVFKHQPTPGERMLDAMADGVEDITDRIRDRFVSQFTGGVGSGLIKASAAAVVTKIAADFIRGNGNVMPSGLDVKE